MQSPTSSSAEVEEVDLTGLMESVVDSDEVCSTTDIPVYFFGLCLFLTPNGLIHCLHIFELFLKIPICFDVNRNSDITFDCLFFNVL